VDETLSAIFDQRVLPFNLTPHELHLMNQLLRDEFYVRRFGSLEAA